MMIGPITPPAASTEYPPTRCRNDGIHHEIPPSENVTAAYPKIAHRYAGFLNSDHTPALGAPGPDFRTRVSSPPVLAGSLINAQIASPTSAPGIADDTKLIRHP
jgi:hypothetical protein